MTDMTPAPISVERLRELLDRAAETLPWRWSTNGNIVPRRYPYEEPDFEIAAVYTERDDDEAPANAELIIETVNALPALLHQLAERDAEVERLEHRITWCMSDIDAAQNRARAAERAREEAINMLREVEPVLRKAGFISVPNAIAAFLAASGGA